MLEKDRLENYLNSHCERADDYLENIEKETWQKVLIPNMISSKYQGRFLSMMSKIINPKYILEIGTYTGYSALCLAEGLQENGKLITLDKNKELIETFTKDKIKNSKFYKNIEIKIGDALNIIPDLNYEFDLVFIDADKKNYINYFNATIDKVRKGGLIISDNVLWKNKVLDTPNEKDTDTKILIEYNDLLTKDKRVDHIILPIIDGLSLTYKK